MAEWQALYGEIGISNGGKEEEWESLGQKQASLKEVSRYPIPQPVDSEQMR